MIWLAWVILAIAVAGCAIVIGANNRVDQKIEREIGVELGTVKRENDDDEAKRKIRDRSKADEDQPRADSRRSERPGGT